MTQYNFDEVINRRGTNSLKHDFAVEFGRPADVLPMWVADMDFRAPQAALDALQKAVDHGIFGYSETKGAYFDAVSGWFKTHFGWETRPEWLVKTPGVVFALSMAVRALTREGDGILVQPPVYYPFFSMIRENGRRLVENPLIYENGRYSIDFEDFERKVAERDVKLFILCSPHNPVGRVWTGEELRRLGGICEKHGVYVISDEIHCDFAFPEHPHTVFLKAVPELQERAIVCTAPSKTFNLAGLQTSNIFIPNEEMRRKFEREIHKTGYEELNTMGLAACQAAYENGADWLAHCRAYMRENLAFLRTFLAERLPQIRLVEPEGTYFAWLDCSGLGLDKKALNDLIINRAKLWLDAGQIFSPSAAQFQRVVLACPRSVLAQGLEQLERAVRENA